MAIDIGWARFRMLGVLARRHHWDCAHLLDRRAERLGVTRHVGQSPGRRLWLAFQQQQRRCQLVCLARHQHEVHEPASRIAYANDLAAKTTPGTAQGLVIAAGLAIESQTHLIGLLGRAPAAF
jgi:hypothetical protein